MYVLAFTFEKHLGYSYTVWNFDWNVMFILPFIQVTEQARSSIEARMKEAEQQHRRLEEKLLEAAKEKQELEEQKRRAQASLEEQVYYITHFNLFLYILIPNAANLL